MKALMSIIVALWFLIFLPPSHILTPKIMLRCSYNLVSTMINVCKRNPTHLRMEVQLAMNFSYKTNQALADQLKMVNHKSLQWAQFAENELLLRALHGDVEAGRILKQEKMHKTELINNLGPVSYQLRIDKRKLL